jgi:hypothetical protein
MQGQEKVLLLETEHQQQTGLESRSSDESYDHQKDNIEVDHVYRSGY